MPNSVGWFSTIKNIKNILTWNLRHLIWINKHKPDTPITSLELGVDTLECINLFSNFSGVFNCGSVNIGELVDAPLTLDV